LALLLIDADHFTVSVGVATMGAEVADADVLIERADLAMHAAKMGGRNRVARWHTGLRPVAAAGEPAYEVASGS
jgi:predicted signal transduction protein with EAL and GGDEF domain